MVNKHNIIHHGSHYEAYNERGDFVCSGDTWNECYDELVEIMTLEARMKILKDSEVNKI